MTDTEKHSHGRDCCWSCHSGPDSHPAEVGDMDCEREGCVANRGDEPMTDTEKLKAALKELRGDVMDNPGLSVREVNDLKAAVIVLIMYINRRVADEERAAAERAENVDV